MDKLVDLKQHVREVRALHNKLILVTGRAGCGKTALVTALAERCGVERVNVGAELSSRLVAVPRRGRAIEAGATTRKLLDESKRAGLCVLDDIEVLFDASLKLDPLVLLKRAARSICVVAVWPGELHGGRLRYAEQGHPEHRDYTLDGVVPFQMEPVQ